ncbi:HTH-type transcriptional regulator PgrR [Starkeya nomas]|uniref:HTH-type transcriptional regulator PgrR n=1 Tax=Starkeya nomas TaxID=2666134 RepID=A0A5S9PXZ6_9HYPH|nr:LysR family transcriptional regulator [Starkeya nomas]CAA0109544.1 HTH-type transcriptional regulator PgrR [Starkeya nomas]
MDRLDAMRLFTRIVERRSFTEAAHDMDVPRSTVTTVIKQMEERLGVRLLQRTTRTVRPTLDGEAWYRRCLAILDDVEDAEGAFGNAEPKGMLRIDVQGTIARHFLLPGLPDFFARHPGIELSMSERDRWVDPVQEGVDCVLRYGELPASDLAARRVATLERLTCAAPSYLERFGTPATLDELAGHRIVGIRLLSSGALTPVAFQVGGTLRRIELPAPFSVTGPESYLLGVRLGLGLAQVPRFHVEKELESGALVELLADTPPPPAPVSLLYPRSRQLSPRVRVFLDWAAGRFAGHGGPGDPRRGAVK